MRRKSMDVVIRGNGDIDAIYLCLEPSSRGENFEGCMQKLFVQKINDECDIVCLGSGSALLQAR